VARTKKRLPVKDPSSPSDSIGSRMMTRIPKNPRSIPVNFLAINFSRRRNMAMANVMIGALDAITAAFMDLVSVRPMKKNAIFTVIPESELKRRSAMSERDFGRNQIFPFSIGIMTIDPIKNRQKARVNGGIF
jgi:hypothetical protein